MDSFHHLEISGKTDVGLRRKNNEDSFCMLPEQGVFILADGMGGGEEGEFASQRAVANVQSLYSTYADSQKPLGIQLKTRLVRQAANQTCEDVQQRMAETSASQMGSTLVGLLFDAAAPQTAVVLHAGDSRAYRFREGELKQISNDHSVSSAVGIEKEEELPAMFRGMLTRAMGLKGSVDLERTEVDLKEGDLLMLCSDGLSGMVPDPALEKLLQQHAPGDIEKLTSELIQAALAGGGKDNVTVIVTRVKEIPPPVEVMEPAEQRSDESGDEDDEEPVTEALTWNTHSGEQEETDLNYGSTDAGQDEAQTATGAPRTKESLQQSLSEQWKQVLHKVRYQPSFLFLLLTIAATTVLLTYVISLLIPDRRVEVVDVETLSPTSGSEERETKEMSVRLEEDPLLVESSPVEVFVEPEMDVELKPAVLDQENDPAVGGNIGSERPEGVVAPERATPAVVERIADPTPTPVAVAEEVVPEVVVSRTVRLPMDTELTGKTVQLERILPSGEKEEIVPLASLELPAGDYQATVQKPGYEDQNLAFGISAESDELVDVSAGLGQWVPGPYLLQLEEYLKRFEDPGPWITLGEIENMENILREEVPQLISSDRAKVTKLNAQVSQWRIAERTLRFASQNHALSELVLFISSPSDSDVLTQIVDNQEGERVPPGVYDLRITLEGHEEWEGKVEVGYGPVTTFDLPEMNEIEKVTLRDRVSFMKEKGESLEKILQDLDRIEEQGNQEAIGEVTAEEVEEVRQEVLAEVVQKADQAVVEFDWTPFRKAYQISILEGLDPTYTFYYELWDVATRSEDIDGFLTKCASDLQQWNLAFSRLRNGVGFQPNTRSIPKERSELLLFLLEQNNSLQSEIQLRVLHSASFANLMTEEFELKLKSVFDELNLTGDIHVYQVNLMMNKISASYDAANDLYKTLGTFPVDFENYSENLHNILQQYDDNSFELLKRFINVFDEITVKRQLPPEKKKIIMGFRKKYSQLEGQAAISQAEKTRLIFESGAFKDLHEVVLFLSQ